MLSHTSYLSTNCQNALECSGHRQNEPSAWCWCRYRLLPPVWVLHAFHAYRLSPLLTSRSLQVPYEHTSSAGVLAVQPGSSQCY